MQGTLAALPSSVGARVLVVDDDEHIRQLLVVSLTTLGCAVEECGSGADALERLASNPPDLVLLDVDLPGHRGLDVLEAIRARPELRLLPVIMITGSADRDEKLRAIRSGVTDFVTKPFDIEELGARVRALLHLKLFTDELEEAELVIVALARTIDARDPYTAGHSERVSLYAEMLGRRIGLSESDVAAVRQGGLFHDLGKIAVRDRILLKPSPLSTDETLEMQRHPVIGRDLLRPMKTLSRALPVVYHHHEKLDGSGYPDGLSGDAIPTIVRVATIADVYDALTTTRPYRVALPRDEALGILRDEARRGWWDRNLVEEFEAATSDFLGLETFWPARRRRPRPVSMRRA